MTSSSQLPPPASQPGQDASPTLHERRRAGSTSAAMNIQTESQPFLSPQYTASAPHTPSSTFDLKTNKADESGKKRETVRRTQPTSGRLDTWWIVEIVCSLTSVACLIVIFRLLKQYDGTPLQSWTFYFSLNTVVSTLGTALRASLVVAASASLAQGKWIWFRKRSGTMDMFEIIDSASRGSVGSLNLLWHTKGRHLVTLGAIVAILSSAIGPSLQALISDKGSLDRDLKSTTPSIGQSERFDGGTQCVDQSVPIKWNGKSLIVDQNISTTPDFAISAAMYDGLSAALRGNLRVVSFNCSGNCTFPLYASLAVCSSCADITAHLFVKPMEQVSTPCTQVYGISSAVSTDESDCTSSGGTIVGQNVTAYTLDHIKLSLENVDGNWRDSSIHLGTVMRAAAITNPEATINFKDSETLLAAYTFILAGDDYVDGSAPWPSTPVTATECGLSLCLNIYNSSIVNGTLYDPIVASASKKVPNSWLPLPNIQQPLKQNLSSVPSSILGTEEWNPVYHATYIAREDFQLDPKPFHSDSFSTNNTFNISQIALTSTLSFLASLIPNGLNQSSINLTITSPDPIYGTPILQPLYACRDNISAAFEQVALSLSNAIRTSGSTPMSGEAWIWVLHYRIRWPYLALSGSLVVITVVLLVASIVQTWRLKLPAWKGSAIATMVYGGDDGLRDRLFAEEDEGAGKGRLDEAAEGVVVEFFPGEGLRSVDSRGDGDGMELRELVAGRNEGRANGGDAGMASAETLVGSARMRRGEV